MLRDDLVPQDSHAAGAHIVVCDDEPDLRDTVAEYLAAHGYDVVTADGGAALRRRWPAPNRPMS